MLNKSRELLYAIIAIFLISLLYLGAVYRLGSIPAAQSFFGHSLGVLGFTLMLMTETLYSLRKRSRFARWGRMAQWLQLHIFTGLVGPFLVLLHSSWKFNGLAGVVLLLTVIIVISGIIGRYIYTAVPRTAEGTEIQARELGEHIRQVELAIEQWLEAHPESAPGFTQQMNQRLATLPSSENSGRLVITRVFSDLAYRLDWLRTRRKLSAPLRAQAAQLDRLILQRRTLQRQLHSLAAARRLLATWHAVHIPIGMALFTTAFIHIGAALYYATLLH